ncbi:MAG: hypothetical protein ACOCM4_15460, partial [Acetivibrio ethanolgignens]
PNSVPKEGKDIRMASFYDYGYYICEAWQEGQGEIFCEQYINMLENQMKKFKKNRDLVDVIKDFLEENDYEWSGTMQNLSTELSNHLDLYDYDQDIKIPSTPNRLSREIRNLKYEMEKANITIEWSKTRDNHSFVSMTLEDD